jgi:hypothetical protein
MYQILKAKVEAIIHINNLSTFRNDPSIHDAAAWWLDKEIVELERDIVRGPKKEMLV